MCLVRSLETLLKTLDLYARTLARDYTSRPSDSSRPALSMASIEQRSVGSAKNRASLEDEKHDPEVIDAESVVDSYDGDEALKLVGRERTVEFSEEYNRRLRRKLVHHIVLSVFKELTLLLRI